MFETISTPRSRKPAAGVAVAVALHVGVLGIVVWITHHNTPASIEVVPGPIHPPRPLGSVKAGGPAAPNPHPHHHPPKKRADLVQPVSVQVAPAPEIANEVPDDAEPDEGEYPGPPSGPIGAIGARDGDPDGTGDRGSFAPGPVQFDEGRMTHPRLLWGPDPAYTPQALEREVEGTLLVRCIVDVQGFVRNCRVIKSLPFMDAAVLHALENRRYAPALIDGRPVEVDYTFRIHISLP